MLDPTGELEASALPLAPRLKSLAGATIGFLDISKPRGDVFLDALQAHLEQRGARVERFRKPTYTKPAPSDIRKQIRERCSAVVEALAD